MSEKVKVLRLKDSDSKIIDQVLGLADLRLCSTFMETRAEVLLRLLRLHTGIHEDVWRPIIVPYIGLPSDATLRDQIRLALEGWMPAILQGHRFCNADFPRFADIPHTVRIHNRGPDIVPGRWLYVLEVLTGPLLGHRVSLSVSERLAAVMMYRTVGVRIFRNCHRLRLYDLHGMLALIGFQRVNGNIILRKVYRPSTAFTSNKALIRKYLGKCRFDPLRNCLDCGRGPEECELSRHPHAPKTGSCVCCGKDQTRLNLKGICVACVQTALKTGVPLRLPWKAKRLELTTS
jgi:hypothetical protein